MRMELSPQQRSNLQELVGRLGQHPVFFQAAMAEQPARCRASLEAYRLDIEQSLQEGPPWEREREGLLELLSRWLNANQDVKRIKVDPKNGRYRSFCGNLLALRGNFRDFFSDFCKQAGVEYPRGTFSL